MNWEQLLSLKRHGDSHKRLRKEQDETRLGFEVDMSSSLVNDNDNVNDISKRLIEVAILLYGEKDYLLEYEDSEDLKKNESTSEISSLV